MILLHPSGTTENHGKSASARIACRQCVCKLFAVETCQICPSMQESQTEAQPFHNMVYWIIGCTDYKIICTFQSPQDAIQISQSQHKFSNYSILKVLADWIFIELDPH